MTKYLPEGLQFDTKEMLARFANEKAMVDAYINNTYLEARATLCDNAHNLHFDLGAIQGFMPHDECAEGVADGSVRDIAIISRVNKPTGFKITDFIENSDGTKTAILSRTLYQMECRREYVNSLNPGDIIDARISHIEQFGAFCDIGAGITALLPIDSISVSRIPSPNVRFSVGDDIKAVVKSIDDSGRVTLSHKELLGTWEENARLFNAGETVTGTVRSVEQYGIFVELTPNLAGLAEYTPIAKSGDTASVFIKSINPERMKIKLIIVDSDSTQSAKRKIRYFADGKHIDEWLYSPPGSEKSIYTVF